MSTPTTGADARPSVTPTIFIRSLFARVGDLKEAERRDHIWYGQTVYK